MQGQAARNGRSWIRTQGLGSPRPHFAQASGLVINSVGPLHPHGSHLSLSSWVSLCCVIVGGYPGGGPSWAGAQSLLCVPLGVTSPF